MNNIVNKSTQISKLSQKRDFNGEYGVIECIASENHIVNNM